MKSMFKRKQQATPPTLPGFDGQTPPLSTSGASSSNETSEGTNSVGPSLAALTAGSKTVVRPRSAQHSNGSQVQASKNAASLGYGFHSMALQIKDAARSLDFYQRVLGMQLVKHSEADDYTMYFLAFPSSDEARPNHIVDSVADDDDEESDRTMFGTRQGMLQLIHVHGSETDSAFKVFTGGPGFTHFSVSVPDVEEARTRAEGMGVTIVEDGSNARGFAAISDPDGYHIQLIAQNEGEDDRLRERLAELMSQPASNMHIVHELSTSLRIPDSAKRRGSRAAAMTSVLGSSPTGAPTALTTAASLHAALKEQHDRSRAADALRMARGGSPVSPASPLPSSLG